MNDIKYKRHSRMITVGNVTIGGAEPIRIQSMTNTDTRDIAKTVAQIHRLEALGCELVRVAVLDNTAADAVSAIKERISIPLIADIHFHHDLAIKAMMNGADAIRINPGNIGGAGKTLEVLKVAKDLNKAVRVGVNAGSLEKDLVKSMGVCADALVESAKRQLEILDKGSFSNFKISIKASSVPMTVDAYTQFSKISDAPLHIGVTEAGTQWMGTIKSAVGIGALLLNGIGDTLRVSLTAEPEEEIKAAWAILMATSVRRRGVEVISCPTCGRTQIDLISLASKVEQACATIDKDITIAVMGCPVNGPGEAKEADYGIAGGKGVGIIFKKGEVVKKVHEEKLLEELIKLLETDS